MLPQPISRTTHCPAPTTNTIPPATKKPTHQTRRRPGSPHSKKRGLLRPVLNENRLWLNPKILPSTILGIHGLDSPQDLFSAKSRPVWEGSQQFAHTHRSRHTPKNEPGCGRLHANPFVSRFENRSVAGSNATLQQPPPPSKTTTSRDCQSFGTVSAANAFT